MFFISTHETPKAIINIPEQDTQQIFIPSTPLFFLEVSNCVRKKDETDKNTKNYMAHSLSVY